MRFSDKTYNTLKWITLVFLPALGTFMGILLPSLDVPVETVKTVVTIISALAAFLGTLIGISTTAYNSEQDNGDN